MRLLVELCVRSRLVATLLCGGLIAFSVYFLVYCVRSLVEYGDAPTRITCAQAPHAPRWATLDTSLDCTRARVEYNSNIVSRSTAPAACPDGAPAFEVAVSGRCQSGYFAYTGDLHFDVGRNIWRLEAWSGPSNARTGVFACILIIGAIVYVYISMEKMRRKRGIPPGQWLP